MVQRHYGTNMIDAGVSRKPMGQTGTLINRVGLAVATPGTVEAVLATLPIPGGAINNKGKGLHTRVIFSSLASGSTKVYSLRYGSLTGTVLATVNSSAASSELLMDAYLLLTDEATGGWESYAWAQLSTTNISSARVAGTDDIRDDWNLVVTGTSASSAGDVVLRAVRADLIVEGGIA